LERTTPWWFEAPDPRTLLSQDIVQGAAVRAMIDLAFRWLASAARLN
jgi:hypothetical protein